MTAEYEERKEEEYIENLGLAALVRDVHSKVADILSRVEDNYQILRDLYAATTKENGWYDWFDEEAY